MGEVRRRFVVIAAIWAGEAVSSARIGMNPDLGAAGEPFARLRRGRCGDIIVARGEMQHHRAGDARGEAERCLDADPVIGDGAIDAALGRGAISQAAAEAEPDHPDPAGAFAARAQRRYGRGDVAERSGAVEFRVKGQHPLPVRWILAEVQPRLEPPIKVRANHQIAFLGIEAGHVAHIPVEAKGGVQQHEPRPATRFGHGQIGAKGASAAARVDRDQLCGHQPYLPFQGCAGCDDPTPQTLNRRPPPISRPGPSHLNPICRRASPQRRQPRCPGSANAAGSGLTARERGTPTAGLP